MKRNILLLFCVSLFNVLFSQVKNDYQWVLDHYNLLDFRQDTLIFSVAEHQINHGSGDASTSISNEEGELQFYSGGCFILNSVGEIMENGDSINSEYAYVDFCGGGDFPFENTAVTFPNNSQKYVYLNLDINIISDSILPAPLHLYYHVIDMGMDGGLGAVVEKKQVLVADTLSRGYVQAARHANGTDWWVIVAEWNSNCYYLTKLTDNGFDTPEKQCMGGVWHNKDGGGQVDFSPDGSKFVRIGGQVGLFLFDFDNEEGVLSSPLELTFPYDQEYFRGAAFSPNSRYLYVSTLLDLFQYDLLAPDIQGSLHLVGQLDPVDPPMGVGSLAIQKLAPNGKIYIASPGSHKYLSVINRPNCPGILCDFQPWAIELPEYNYAGLPNLPHFSIPQSDNDCDSLSSTVSLMEQELFYIFPNPASDKLFLQINAYAHQYIIFDILGSVRKQGGLNKYPFEIDISDLLEGIYFVGIRDVNGNKSGIKKFIVQRN